MLTLWTHAHFSHIYTPLYMYFYECIQVMDLFKLCLSYGCLNSKKI